MFHTNTVLIVGAGASAELGLPTGYDLRMKIAELVNIKFLDGYSQSSGDYQIMHALRRIARSGDPSGNVNPYIHEGWSIANAMPQALSIDNYLEAHDDNEKLIICGKLAIARAILQAEHDSRLYHDRRSDERFSFWDLENTWITKFFQIATEGVSKSRLESIFDNVSVVSFNYDRCIRHFVAIALRNYYVLDEQHANRLASKLKIFHPYGVTGRLPWEDSGGGVEFGAIELGERLVDLASGIKTFSERIDDVEYLNALKANIQQAQRIVYLGYAFHNQNQNLLKLDMRTQAKEVFASVYHISESDQRVVKKSIMRQLGADGSEMEITLHDTTAGQLIRDFWRTLSN